MEKQGILKIEKKDGVWKAYVIRADKQEIAFLHGEDAEKLSEFNGKECTYFSIKKDIQKVLIGKKDIFPLIVKSPRQPRKVQSLDLKGRNVYGTNPDFTKLPFDTKRIIELNKIDNFNLKLNKTAHFIKIKNSNVHFNEFNNDLNTVLFRSSLQSAVDTKVKHHFHIKEEYGDHAVFQMLAQRHLQNAKNILGAANVKESNLITDWRMIVGIGNESVFETSMTLHHIYGFPYIPASAVKGVVRSHVIKECFGVEKESEKEAMGNALFVYIFGTTSQAGKFVFFDAYPTEVPMIEADVMTPHYGDYYSKGVAPADFLSPNPIPFLTVNDTCFQFIVGVKENTHFQQFENWKFLFEKGENLFFKDLKNNESCLNLVQCWLEAALTNHGIGAKTAVGYGYMQ